jgi:mRNA interferase MazF
MNCSRNDVVLLPIPFTDLTSRKVRPAIVVGENGADLFLVPISSVIANTDFPLNEWRAAGLGLNVPSGIKAQIATVDEKLVVKIVGRLTDNDTKVLNVRLRKWLKL